MGLSELPTDSQQFWNSYLNEHQSISNRWIHALGTVGSWGIFISAFVVANYWLILLAPFVGYLFAWAGHFLIEKNQPLTLKSPFRSLKCDYWLTFLTLTRQYPVGDVMIPNPEED